MDDIWVHFEVFNYILINRVVLHSVFLGTGVLFYLRAYIYDQSFHRTNLIDFVPHQQPSSQANYIFETPSIMKAE